MSFIFNNLSGISPFPGGDGPNWGAFTAEKLNPPGRLDVNFIDWK
jgi:hypothetical protein